MTGSLPYAGVIVAVRAEAVDRIFHYSIPPKFAGKIERGRRVLVPFGPRQVEGYVVELTDQIPVEIKNIRSILRPLDQEPLIIPSLMELAEWMQSRYAGLLAEALQLMLPPGYRYGKERTGVKTQQQVVLLIANPPLKPNASAQKRVLEILRDEPRMLAARLVKKAAVSYSVLRSLAERGVLKIEEVRLEREIDWQPAEDPPLTLTDEQASACNLIRREMQGKRRPVLLHGVTGSGKTEIYLRLIAEVLAKGRQALVLVPEIALTPQMVSRFAARFGPRIAVLHSALSPGERFDQWWKIYRAEVDVVIGARSAVFAPTPQLGLIVMDEEHETTYKQEEGTIRYQTREVAIQRCKLSGGLVILGSATPALESYHRALHGQYLLAELKKRVQQRPLPPVEIVDMRREFEEGNRSMFSAQLRLSLEELKDTENQAIILLNRRGFANFVLCRECGHVLQCPNCQVSLTYHQSSGRLHCHYCLHKEILPERCPICASPYLRQFGVGTEQVQAVLSQEFPFLKAVRLDSDTTRRKGAHASILQQFERGQAQVLIGTQMVAKGLDFPKITLVGVLSADLALNFPDIRASERTFQLLTQVAGRSGRGIRPGRVIIQAYDPDHFALAAAQRHDYLGFYRQEITHRRSLGYPPFSQLTRILVSGPWQEARQTAVEIEKYLLAQELKNTVILGPLPAPISKIKGRHRWQIVLKSGEVLSEVLKELPSGAADVQIVVDIDPIFML